MKPLRSTRRRWVSARRLRCGTTKASRFWRMSRRAAIRSWSCSRPTPIVRRAQSLRLARGKFASHRRRLEAAWRDRRGTARRARGLVGGERHRSGRHQNRAVRIRTELAAREGDRQLEIIRLTAFAPTPLFELRRATAVRRPDTAYNRGPAEAGHYVRAGRIVDCARLTL